MRSDRYTKVVLTIIAVCLSALTLTGIGLPDFATEAEATIAPASASALQGYPKPGGEAGVVRALAAATLPLRWKVSWVTARGGGTYCGTAIIVTNDTNSTVSVEVEWFNFSGSSVKLNSGTPSPLRQVIWVSGYPIGDPGVDPAPFVPDGHAQLDGVIGYARVHADDPRIEVAAFQYCRDGIGGGKNITSITQVPVYPVGATMDYFQAVMPATWTPPMVVPEVPE